MVLNAGAPVKNTLAYQQSLIPVSLSFITGSIITSVLSDIMAPNSHDARLSAGIGWFPLLGNFFWKTDGNINNFM